MKVLSTGSALVIFNEVGSFHEYWQDFHLVRKSPGSLDVMWVDDGGDTVRYELSQHVLDRFVDGLVEFVPYRSDYSSSTFIIIVLRSKAGEFEHTYCRVERKRKRAGARLLRMLGSRERLQKR